MNDLVRITQWLEQEDATPSVHECLKPLEARSLLIDEGGKGYYFGHRCEEYASVLDQGASWVWWSGSTWLACMHADSVWGANQPVRTL